MQIQKYIVISIAMATAGHAEKDALEKYKPEIEAAVKAGEISRELAEKKYQWLKRKGKNIELEVQIEEIKKALENGKITAIDAQRKFKFVKVSEKFKAAKEEIATALGSGTITKNEAAEKYEILALKWSKLTEGKKEKPGFFEPDIDQLDLEKRIDKALESGKITPQQAEEKYKSIRQPT